MPNHQQTSKGMLPCLLCGSPVVFHHDPEDCPGGCHNIQCLTCKAMFDLATAADPDNACETLEELQDRIVAVWNKRPTPEPATALRAQLAALAAHMEQHGYGRPAIVKEVQAALDVMQLMQADDACSGSTKESAP